MFTKLIDALKATRRTIVFTEGPDARILEAADRLIKDDLMNVILIGNVDEVKAAAEKGGFDIAKAEIIDPATYAGMDEMVQKMVELRKGKMSEEDCRKALAKGNYFGTMLVKMGKADALLGGATYSTADTVRPALQLVKTKKGAHLVSSSFILFRKDKDGKRVKQIVDKETGKVLAESHRDKDGKLVKIENGVTVTVYDEVEKEIKKDLPTRSHARRQMLKVLNPVVEVPADAAGKKKNTKEVDLVAKLFDEYAPKYATRKGGYTRIVKIGQRKGDAAMTVVLELV